MEHVLDAEGIARLNLSIPFVCEDTFEYDRKVHFLQYGQNLGYKEAKARFLDDGSNGYELSVVLQKWLFFGLITEFFGTANINIETSDFVRRTTSDRQVITTALLNPLLQKWARNIQTLQSEQRTAAMMTVLESLREAQVHLKYLGEHLKTPLSEVLLSISTAGTSLAFAQRHVFRPGGTCPVPEWTDHLHYRSWGKSRLMVEKLISDGWCEYEIAQLYGGSFSAVGILFAASLERPRRRESHQNCSEKICRAFTIDEATYKTQHIEDDCACNHLEINHGDLCSIMKSGQTAILRLEWSESGLLQIKALPSQGVEYVAISHVWSDGLGNAVANSLPTCQLEHLDRLVRRMRSIVETEPIYLWIDTLCVTARGQAKTCPTEIGELNCRGLAIRRMRDTYRDATDVLVLDWQLQRSSVATKPEESLLRILTSGWMRRLWTFQEAWLSRNLSVQFRDRAVHLKHLLLSLDMEDHLPLWAEVADAYLSTQKGIMSDFGQSQRVGFLWNALQSRTTSHLSDEPVVLGTMLGMDITQILKAADDQRMFTFLSSIDVYPSQILFMPGPRMEEPGYGWAPTSFLGRQQWTTTTALGDNLLSSAGVHAMDAACAPAFRADSGLLLRRAVGFVLLPFSGLLLHAFSVVLEDGQFMGLIHYLEEENGPEWSERKVENHSHLGILIDGGEGKGFSTLAVLVSDCQMQGGILFAKFICRLWFGASKATEAVPTQDFAVDEVSGQRYSTLVRVKAVKQDQMWCIS